MARKKRAKKPIARRPLGVAKLIGGSSVSRMASLAVLIAIIIVILILFYKVMAGFILPLFLAALFAVIFRPIHRWMLTRFRDKDNLAAGFTTAAILGIVLLPLFGIFGMAYYEGQKKTIAFFPSESKEFRHKLQVFGTKYGLNRPFDGPGIDDRPWNFLDQAIIVSLPDRLPTAEDVANGRDFEFDKILNEATSLRNSVKDTIEFVNQDGWEKKENDDAQRLAVKRLKKKFDLYVAETTAEAAKQARLAEEAAAADGDDTALDAPNEKIEPEAKPIVEQFLDFLSLNPLIESLQDTDEYLDSHADDATKNDDETNPNALAEFNSPRNGEPNPIEPDLTDHDRAVRPGKLFPDIKKHYQDAREKLTGGPGILSVPRMYLSNLFFPSEDQFERGKDVVQKFLLQWAPSVTKNATAFAGQLAVGMAILILGMFYFLRDGPGMIRAVMRLSPLDDRYEQELLSEFDSVSRAVVLATLLSALCQGLLAGIGYYFAGFESLFLLTMLTMVMAMVPVVGAGSIWIPACLWLAIVDDRLIAAIVLAFYGVLVISMADNIVKPIVLHGQSNLHPLLALLSVLGGVASLGPIGIIVGPMVVSFLQALLNMLHLELQAFDQEGSAEPAASGGSAGN